MARRAVFTVSDTEDSVRVYLDAIGRHQLLTKDDEARLAQEIEAGLAARRALEEKGVRSDERRRLERTVRRGESAWETFVQSNLRLVVSIAKRYQSSGVPLLDLVQEGNLGLMHAVDKFDWRKGFKFSTYATWWIRQAIQRGIANSARVIRLPAQAEEELLRLRAAWARGEETPGAGLSEEDLAARADLSVGRVRELLPYLGDLASLDSPIGEGDEAELVDLVPDAGAESPEDAALRSVLGGEVAGIMRLLDDREREVMALRYGLDQGQPRTPEEVSAMVDLSRERVRQIEAKALARLRHPAAGAVVARLAG